ncbi:MAG: hypothetical protein A2087_02470 [Spirochaetes bacterium GWD1_61_31]|nr:MAG: hypothetical protein A2Y37_13965 [Spirochaetes bacterium GWB1_60_80]OHD38152.1 MAG: hypothetical protein A2087_02470 [Spirochaetes bacterium GWD1_61_31]OHD45296.1 MAG: hypothetical protein A2Y35_02545 [Spirochaetes bacterium GWE1_60_18]OHD59602.1 MAG: hypothetical protein A2Y32_12790 [Spirochaetes bacterium GWF1_60_12]HAP43986.1 hypothetical protein [Spirochaetaceae bacterium]
MAYDTTGGTAFLAAAAVSLAPTRLDKAANLEAIGGMVARVMQEHPTTDVIVFHELCTSWLTDPETPADYFSAVAETVPGPSTEYVAALAAAHGVAIVFGLAERAGALYYNAQVCVQPDGSLVTYRKRGLNAGDIANGCSPGDGPVSAMIVGVPVTFAICSDYQSEAVIRDLSLADAPVVLMSLVTATVLNPMSITLPAPYPSGWPTPMAAARSRASTFRVRSSLPTRRAQSMTARPVQGRMPGSGSEYINEAASAGFYWRDLAGRCHLCPACGGGDPAGDGYPSLPRLRRSSPQRRTVPGTWPGTRWLYCRSSPLIL